MKTYILQDSATENSASLDHPKLLYERGNTSDLFHNIIQSQAQALRQKRSIDGLVMITNIRDGVASSRIYNWWLDTKSGMATIGGLSFIALGLVIVIVVLTIESTYWKPKLQ